MERRSDRVTRMSWPPPWWLLLLAIMALAVIVRLYGIAAEALWLDETTSLMLARMDVPSLIRWTANDIHPPLYYILLHFWIAIGHSEIAIRGFSALAGVLTVLVLFGLGDTLFDRATGLWAALFLALNPLHVWYSQEARMYALLTLLYSTSLLLALKSWQRGRWYHWVGYALVTAATLYTHHYAVFIILLENLFFLYLYFFKGRSSRLLRGWVLAELCVVVFYFPWMPRLLANLSGGGGWLAYSQGLPSIAVLPQTAILYVVGTGREFLPETVRRLAYLVFVLAGLAVLWPLLRPGALTAPRETSGDECLFATNQSLLLCLACLVVPLGLAWLASQVFKPMYSARYMLPFLPAFVLLLARAPRQLRGVWGRGLLVTGLLIAMGVSIVTQVEVTEKPDWRSIAQRIIGQARPGDAVLFVPGWHIGPFEYYAHNSVQLYGEMPAMVAHTPETSLRYVREVIAKHPRIWFIWETGHYSDPTGRVYALLRENMREAGHESLPLLGDLYLMEAPSLGAKGADG